ncbi:MAG TPA: hypothetical protein VN872_02045 [Candidatus Acidoferrum sp.]|nr:hypothetical protein [Candidatus Acidoferrum sp.]
MSLTRKSVLLYLALLAVCLLSSRSAHAQSESLDALLDRAGNNVARFLDKLGDVHCNEEVLQEKFNPKGKTEERVQSTFDYLVLTQFHGSEPMLYESREAQRAGHIKKNISMLVTNGFATQLLIFHPYYQSSFSFERLPDAHINGKTFIQVHFQHVKGRLSPAVLMLRGREYPLSLAGTARLDPETGAVRQIITELGVSMEDLGLRSFRTEVNYNAVTLPHDPKSYWLPAQATVELNTARQHWKNVHHFSEYRLFSVNVEEKVDTNKLKAQDQ